MRLLTLFSGIGSPEQGAKRVYGDDFELVAACEWDKFARESFKANYEIEDKHFHKDIADMDGKQYRGKVDVVVGGSPCQDFSLAGLRDGVDGNKGILIYEYIRIIEEVQPPIFIYENVKGMLSDKGGRTIKDFVTAFRDMGYFCHYEVLNTKDYGVPQNRERIFLVGFKDSEHYHNFSFAPKIKLEKRLRDVLDDQVEEKYYLSDKMINFLKGHSDKHEKKGNGFKFETRDVEGVASCLRANGALAATDNTIKVKSTTKKGYETATAGDSINLSHPKSKTRRGRVGKQVSQTLDCACNLAVVEPKLQVIGMLDIKGNESIRRVHNSDGLSPTLTTMEGGNRQPKIQQDFKIRKLTPRECFRLQDFPDTFEFVVSNSQLYKQAGNSISVNVMEMIFNQIEKSRHENSDKGSLF